MAFRLHVWRDGGASLVTSNLRDDLLRVVESLTNGEPSVCGEAPTWVIENVKTRLNTALASDDSQHSTVLAVAVRAAIWLINDQCGSECDILGGVLYKLVETDGGDIT
jgi:hypothetical protein